MTPAIVEKHAKTLLNDLIAILPTIQLERLAPEECGELAAAMRTVSFLIVSAADLAALRPSGVSE